MEKGEKMSDKLVDAFIETIKGGEETIKACEKLLSMSYEELAEEIERFKKEQDAQVGKGRETDG
jgi:hypothetical protein